MSTSTFPEDALERNRRKAIERKTGARGLRSIMEAILLDTMFELPAMEGVEEVVISAEVVTGEAKPLMIYSDKDKSLSPSQRLQAGRAAPDARFAYTWILNPVSLYLAGFFHVVLSVRFAGSSR